MEGKTGNGKKYGVIAVGAVLVLAAVFGGYWLGRSSGGGTDVGEENAKLAALKHAQVSESELTRFGIERDERSGRAVYEVEFTADGVEYDYEVSAADGSIVKFQRERDDGAPPAQAPAAEEPVPAGDIGEARAWEIAYAHAGVAAADAVAARTETDYDNGALVYELEFFAGGYEYDYEISAVDGSVVKFGKESGVRTSPVQTPAGDDAGNGAGGSAGDSTGIGMPAGNSASAGGTPASSGAPANTPESSAQAGDIGEARAREIAFSHAGVAAGDASVTQSKTDYEDGALVYELEFFAGGYEYDYEVRASDGTVLKSEREPDGRSPAVQASAGSAGGETAYIGELRAREIAYASVGVAAEDVLHCEVELDHHDGYHSGHGGHHAEGCCRYEIEFKCGGYEYDCEVDAVTGEILKSQRELDD